MSTLRHLSTDELVRHAKRNLRRAPDPAEQGANFQFVPEPRPTDFQKPAYRSYAYHSALKKGWISPEEEQGDRAAYEQRRTRSLQTCHRYSLYEKPRHTKPQPTRAYVPELGAQLESDRNLTDGARRLARKLAEIIYRQNRAGRSTEITVTYLMEALSRTRRTIQRYLRILEREGYIYTEVIRGLRSRMCLGLHISLDASLFAAHHQKAWPQKATKSSKIPGAPKKSQNYNFIDSRKKGRQVSVHHWTQLCMDGVFRSFMKTDPLGLMETSKPLPS